MRLTRRGRMAFTLLFLALVMLTVVGFAARSAATDEAGLPEKTRTVEVQRGDTLWEIASTVAGPRDDVREMVYRIEQLNALPGAAVYEGQELEVPLG